MVKRDGVILEKAALRAVTSFSFREGFLSPTRGTEGVVKTIEKRGLVRKVELSLQERRRGRKYSTADFTSALSVRSVKSVCE